MALQSINPANGELLAHFDTWDQTQLDLVVKRAGLKFADWAQRTTLEARCDLMRRVAELLRAQKTELATLITLEMGKTLREAEAEVEKSAWVCEFYADKGPSFLADELIETDASKSFVC